MKSITFTVVGLPVGQPRVRACVRGRHAKVYDPGTANGWKACVIKAAHESMQSAQMGSFHGPVQVMITYWLPRPKGHFRTGKHAGEIRTLAPTHPAGKPDLDNLDKATLDALTNAAVWIDDSQVVVKSTAKQYGDHGGARVSVREVVE